MWSFHLSSQPGAGICKFGAKFDGHDMKNIVKETVDEGTDYDEATHRDPISAFMIEEKRPDVFVVMQTNVGPNTASIDQDLLHFVKVENQCKRL